MLCEAFQGYSKQPVGGQPLSSQPWLSLAALLMLLSPHVKLLGMSAGTASAKVSWCHVCLLGATRVAVGTGLHHVSDFMLAWCSLQLC